MDAFASRLCTHWTLIDETVPTAHGMVQAVVYWPSCIDMCSIYTQGHVQRQLTRVNNGLQVRDC